MVLCLAELGASVPPNENICHTHTHTQNSHVLHFPVELKVLGKGSKGGDINCIVLYRVLFLCYLKDQHRSIALVKLLLDFLKVIITTIVCLATVIDS